MTTVHIVASTHAGSVRPIDEDAYGATGLAPSTADGDVVSALVSDQPALVVVADGLGGHPCGEVSSHVAVDALLAAEPTEATSLIDAVHEANAAVVAMMGQQSECLGMGTTIAAVLVHSQGIAVVNVGDSAVFELVDDRLVQLSTDDVPASSSNLPGLPS